MALSDVGGRLTFLTGRASLLFLSRQGRIRFHGIPGVWIRLPKDQHIRTLFHHYKRLVDVPFGVLDLAEVQTQVFGQERIRSHAFGDSVVVSLLGKMGVLHLVAGAIQLVNVFDIGILIRAACNCVQS